MILLIGGHQRSGTTLLQTLCHLHPEIGLTNEFGNFTYLGHSFNEYARHVWTRWRRVQGMLAFDVADSGSTQRMKFKNLAFIVRHLYFLRQQCGGTAVTPAALEAIYHRMFPCVKVIGDKWPHYLYRMNKFVKEDDLVRLVIYRDCRDVASSTLVKARTSWKNSDWVGNMDTAEKIATRWVRAIEIMETHADKLVILQYEALMHEPAKELQRISEAIGVNPAGFPPDMIDPGSIGKYQKGLTPEELGTILKVAGPTMERLGYLS